MAVSEKYADGRSPHSGMDSSSPRRWRGEQLHHHGDVVCHVAGAFCVDLSGHHHSSYADKCKRITMRWGYEWVTQACTIQKITLGLNFFLCK